MPRRHDRATRERRRAAAQRSKAARWLPDPEPRATLRSVAIELWRTSSSTEFRHARQRIVERLGVRRVDGRLAFCQPDLATEAGPRRMAWAGHDGKVCYPDRPSAEQAAAELTALDGLVQNVYACPRGMAEGAAYPWHHHCTTGRAGARVPDPTDQRAATEYDDQHDDETRTA